MSEPQYGDVVVTVPQTFGLDTWIGEGQLPGEPWNGKEYCFYIPAPAPLMYPGDRVYVVYKNKLRGYAPLEFIERAGKGWALIRRGGAVAVTIAPPIRGFRGWRYRWWDRADEVPFPEWSTP